MGDVICGMSTNHQEASVGCKRGGGQAVRSERPGGLYDVRLGGLLLGKKKATRELWERSHME